MVRQFTVVLFLGLVISGCAYRWGMPEKAMPGLYQQVHIPIFNNKSQEPQIEVFYTNSLISEMERSKVARIVDQYSAPVHLTGTIVSVDYLPAGRREGGDLPPGTILASQYRIVVQVHLELIRVFDKKVIWSTALTGERAYVAPQVTQPLVNTVNPIYNQSARRIHLELLSQQMMSEAVSLMLANF